MEYEKLVGDVETQIRSLIEHCDLPWQESCLQPHRGEAAVTTASAVQVRSPVYGSAVFHWRHYEHLLGEAQRILDQAGIGYR